MLGPATLDDPQGRTGSMTLANAAALDGGGIAEVLDGNVTMDARLPSPGYVPDDRVGTAAC